MINNKDPHSPGWWLSRAGSWRPPSLALPTVDHGLIQGAGSGRSGPGPGSCLTSLRLQGVQGEVTGVAERQNCSKSCCRPGVGEILLFLNDCTGASPRGAFGSLCPETPLSSWASTRCRLRNEPQKGRGRFTANHPHGLLDQESHMKQEGGGD